MSNIENMLSMSFDEVSKSTDSDFTESVEEIYYKSVVIANNKAHNTEPWNINPSSYLINRFLHQYTEDKVALFNFGVDGKNYTEKHTIFDDCIESILEDFSKNSNKKSIFKYSSNLSSQLFDIFIDYLNENNTIKDSEKQEKGQDFLNLKFKSEDVNEVIAKFSSRLKNFERDLLIHKYPRQKDDIDNKNLRDLVYATNEILYVTSSKYLFILSYTPANEQYFNDKIKESSKAPSFSIQIYEREVEGFFIDNYEKMNQLHSNFIQFIYSSDINQNVANAMGESSLISQHWYTKGVETVLNDHKNELKKAKNSKLLAEYIMRYIVAAEIEGVDFIEVYPFDRAFIFSEAIDFSSNNVSTTLDFDTAEGLIESKITHKDIIDKEFLGGKTRYAYEWERIKANLPIEKFNPSKKKLKFIENNVDKLNKEDSSEKWIEPFDKDIDTAINNMIYTFRSDSSEKDNSLLEYESKYVDNNIVYLYTSGVNLKTQMPSVYDLQSDYLNSIKKDEKAGIQEFSFEERYENEESDFNFKNAKVVLFSYVPEEGDEAKGFTILLIANQDVEKAEMEQKAEKDDLHTALKLLVNQHFTIDSEYKKEAEKEQKELIDILSQTEHSLKNTLDEFIKDENNYNKDSLEKLKDRILNLLSQDRNQMEENGREASELSISHSSENTLNNSLQIIRKMMSTSVSSDDDDEEGASGEVDLNKKFDSVSTKAWDVFAQKLFKLKIEDLKDTRIQELEWTSGDPKKKQNIVLKIDFNEIQDFIIEWKESLFNDAIYVMLKNACEHSIETMKDGDYKREIFLDLYISNQDEQDFLNIEFTNHTSKMCEHMFEHINKGTIQKDNKNKENSTGIGVVTIRKRLDVTYGLDKSNIKFTMIGTNKIKSRLFVPIKSIISVEDVFISYEECNKVTNILYFEDEKKYYTHNIKLLNEHGIECDHHQGINPEIDYGNYDILITDLNIRSHNSPTANATYGHEAIHKFTKTNPEGTVIILSTDYFKERTTQYTIVKGKGKFEELLKSTVYIPSVKNISEIEFIIDPILEVYRKNTLIKTTKKNTNEKGNNDTKQNFIQKSFSTDKVKKFNMLNNKNNVSDIDETVFIYDGSNIYETVIKWENCVIDRGSDLDFSLSNSEVPEQFLTKLVIKTNNTNGLYMPAINHEALRRNIIFVSKNTLNEDIVKIANNTLKYIHPEKGILRQMDHDVISKMAEFGSYTQKNIENIRNHKNKLVDTFAKVFDNLIQGNGNNDFKDVEDLFLHFLKDMKKLEAKALSSGNNVGSSFIKLQRHVNMLEYLKEEV